VFAIERSGPRRELARQLGADPVINPAAEDVVTRIRDLTSGDGVGTIVEASGHAPAVSQAFKYLRKGGRFFILGNVKAPLTIEAIPDIVTKEARIRGFHGRELWSTWERAEELAASGAIPFDKLITHRLPLEEFKQGFEASLSGQAGKVVFEL
jgi:threonine 3-dehydrogenase